MQDKVVIITGASQGLGKEVAKILASYGTKVVLVARNGDKLKKLAEEIGKNASYYVCDIRSADEIKTTTNQILSKFGKVNILINNAGIWTDEEIEKSNPGRRKEAIETNVLGTIEFCKALEPTFIKQGYGHILNVISTSGDTSTGSGDNTNWHTYGASKWAVAGFTRALKDSMEKFGVKVTGFYPGGFESNLYENAKREPSHNQPWMMQAQDIAEALVFCLTRPEDVLVEKLVVTKFKQP